MRALEVSLNGKRICVAGVNNGVVTTYVNLVDHVSGEKNDFCAIDGTEGPAPGTFYHWGHRSITVGDELTIRVVETDSVDAPTKRITAAELWPEKFGE